MVTLTDGKKKLYEGELPITQFGVIEYLAPVLFNKNSTIKVYFDPNDGRITQSGQRRKQIKPLKNKTMVGEGHMLDMIRRMKEGRKPPAYVVNGEMTS